MDFSKNIKISSDFSKSNKIDIHNRKLKIATLNLDDYNLRLQNYACKINYEVENYKFTPIVSDTHSFFITEQINYFVDWDLQDSKAKNEQVKLYLANIHNLHFEDISLIITNSQNDKLSNPYLNRFIEKRNLFKLRFENTYPLGFLSVEQEKHIKDELNKLCNKLDSLLKFL